ncbi:MAG: hypothetical protein KIT81_03550 [Alphaproteobacteria bacterium]|nr:hypothetical protein [Alphaproteobacteria bacterium]
MTTPSTIRVVIPLKVKRRNGRPRIVPPADLDAVDEPMPDPRTLRAIARAWDWRRRLERGEVTTLSDIAQAEQVTLPFVSRTIRLAYLSPMVLERLLIYRRPSALPLDKLAAAALAPWAEQPEMIFD